MSTTPTISKREVYEVEGREFTTREEALQYVESRLGTPELIKTHELLKSLTSRLKNELKAVPLLIEQFDLTESPVMYDLREYESSSIAALNVKIELNEIDEAGFSVLVKDHYEFREKNEEGDASTSKVVAFSYDELSDFESLLIFVHGVYTDAEKESTEALETLKTISENLNVTRLVDFFEDKMKNED